jgi:hypothetical protein
MHYAKTASRLRSQILRFSGELPGLEDQLSLVLVRGFGEESLMLLTSAPLKRT